MAFREKSAWVMMVIMLASGIFYFTLVMQAPAAPVIGALLPYVLLVVLASVVAQVALALMTPREASAPADEREQIAAAKAARWSGTVCTTGVILACGAYVAHPLGNMLFHHVIFAVIIAQIVDYALQIAFLRRTV